MKELSTSSEIMEGDEMEVWMKKKLADEISIYTYWDFSMASIECSNVSSTTKQMLKL